MNKAADPSGTWEGVILELTRIVQKEQSSTAIFIALQMNAW